MLVDPVDYSDLVSESTVKISIIEVKEIKKEKQKVYIKTASWCGYCKRFITEYEQLKDTLPYELVQISDENGTNLPQIYWYKAGKKYYYNGYVPPAGIVEWL